MNPLQERKLSGFQLSIATGMAMETLFAPRREVYDASRTPPPRASLDAYDTLYVNLLTLTRNIINASEYGNVREIRSEMVNEAINEEVEQIQSLCANEGYGKITPVFYESSYSGFYRGKGPEYQLRLPNTEKQSAFASTVRLGIDATVRAKQFAMSYVVDADFRPRIVGDRAIMLSHITPDLLGYSRFGNLELLESHTGKIKTKRDWNTKYSPLGKEDLTHLPWCKPLLCYFGDQYVLQPLSIGLRKTILDVSKERRWSPLTNAAIVYADCMKIKNPDSVTTLKKIGVY